MSLPTRRYAVFISYRHADNKEMGRKWANWLHEALEGYEIPGDLIGTTNLRGEVVPASLYPVFRDEEELPADADLSTNICRALENSGLLVVLCSPRAVQSRFVADEIRYFKELGKSHCILALMIDGEPNASDDPVKVKQMGPEAECFPEPLRFGVPDKADLRKIDWTKRTEPIAADARPGCRPVEGWTSAAAYDEELVREGKLSKAQREEAVREYGEQLELAKLKVVAGALGLPLGVLTQRDKAAQLAKAKRRATVLRRWLAVVGVLTVAAVVAGVMARVQYVEADKQFREANRQLERSQYQEGMTWLEKARAAAERYEMPKAVYYAGRAMGFRDCGRKEPVEAAFAEAFPLLLADVFETSEALEEKRLAGLQDAKGMLYEGTVKGLPMWASPAPVEGEVVEINDMAFSPDGTLLAAAMDDGRVRIWDLVTGKEAEVCEGHETEVTSVAFSGDGLRVASGGEDGTVRVHEVEGGREVLVLRGHEEMVRRVVYAKGGEVLASCSVDKTVRLWDGVSGAELKVLKGHSDEVGDVAFTEDGVHLVSGSSDSTLKLWEVASGREVRAFEGHRGAAVVSVAVEGQKLVSAGKDGTIWIWDLETGEGQSVETDLSQKTRVAIAPGGWVMALGYEGGMLQLESLTGETVLSVFSHENTVTGLAFSPDGLRLATGSRDGQVKLWDVDSSGGAYWLEGESSVVREAVFSSDGASIVSGSEDGMVRVWDVATRRVLFELSGHEKEVTSVRFSPDGGMVASGSADQSVRLWDVASGAELKVMRGHQGTVRQVVFSPDGTLLASVSDGEVMRLWRVADGSLVSEQGLEGFDPDWMAFSEDGTRLAVAKRGMETVLNEKDVETAANGVKMWRVPMMEAVEVPPLGERGEIAGWFAKADQRKTPDGRWMLFAYESGLQVAPAETGLGLPNLVELMDRGLVKMTEVGEPMVAGVVPVAGAPVVGKRMDPFCELVAAPTDDGVRLRLLVQNGQTERAMALWDRVGNKATPQMRREFVLGLVAAGEGEERVRVLAGALTPEVMKDASVAGAVRALLAKLPAGQAEVLRGAVKE